MLIIHTFEKTGSVANRFFYRKLPKGYQKNPPEKPNPKIVEPPIEIPDVKDEDVVSDVIIYEKIAEGDTSDPGLECVIELPPPSPPKEVLSLCSVCGLSVPSQKYRAHLRKHNAQSEKPNLKCDVCDRVLSSPYTLRQHKLTHLDPEQREQIICEVCAHVSPSRVSAKAHALVSYPFCEI